MGPELVSGFLGATLLATGVPGMFVGATGLPEEATDEPTPSVEKLAKLVLITPCADLLSNPEVSMPVFRLLTKLNAFDGLE